MANHYYYGQNYNYNNPYPNQNYPPWQGDPPPSHFRHPGKWDQSYRGRGNMYYPPHQMLPNVVSTGVGRGYPPQASQGYMMQQQRFKQPVPQQFNHQGQQPRGQKHNSRQQQGPLQPGQEQMSNCDQKPSSEAYNNMQQQGPVQPGQEQMSNCGQQSGSQGYNNMQQQGPVEPGQVINTEASTDRQRERSGSRHGSKERRDRSGSKGSKDRNRSQEKAVAQENMNKHQQGNNTQDRRSQMDESSRGGTSQRNERGGGGRGRQNTRWDNGSNRQGDGGQGYGRQGYGGQGYGGQGYGRQGSWKDEDPMVFLSKTLSSILRHNAEKFKLKLMKGGFVYVNEILTKVNKLQGFTVEDVIHVVESNDKKRFSLEEDETGRLKIRANQGHTLQVEDLELRKITSADEFPKVIHGTYHSSWEFIKKTGLSRMKRNHIHFAAGEPGKDGVISGMRSSCEVVIYLDLKKALDAGLEFFVSANNVILSPGNAEGYIFPCFFEGVLDRYYRTRIEFDHTISSLGQKQQQQPQQKSGKNKMKRKNKGKNLVARKIGITDLQVNILSANAKCVVNVKDQDSNHSEESDRFVDAVDDGNFKAEDKMEHQFTDSSDSNQEQPEAEPVSGVAKTPQDAQASVSQPDPPKSEWDDFITVADADQSKCIVDDLTSKPPATIVVCYAPDNFDNKKLGPMVLLAQPKIFLYDLTEDGPTLFREGNLEQLFKNEVSQKVFLDIGTFSSYMVNDYDFLLDGCPVWDLLLVYSKVRGAKGFSEEALDQFDERKIKPNVFKEWKAAIEKRSGPTDDIVEVLIEQGKQMLFIFESSFGFLEKDRSLQGSVKIDVYEKAYPESLREKAKQLREKKTQQKKEKESAEKLLNPNQYYGKTKGKNKKKKMLSSAVKGGVSKDPPKCDLEDQVTDSDLEPKVRSAHVRAYDNNWVKDGPALTIHPDNPAVKLSPRAHEINFVPRSEDAPKISRPTAASQTALPGESTAHAQLTKGQRGHEPLCSDLSAMLTGDRLNDTPLQGGLLHTLAYTDLEPLNEVHGVQLNMSAKNPEGSNQVSQLALAIRESTVKIVEAIDNNTRAVCQQAKTVEGFVSELACIERRMSALERAFLEKQ